MSSSSISRAFKDISLSFRRNPVSNDIIAIKNEDAIKKSVTNLVRTRIGERFFNDTLGTSIEGSLFDSADDLMLVFLNEQITTLLNNYEPRIRLNNVNIEAPDDSNDLLIQINYDIVGLAPVPQNIEFILQPTRI